MAKIEVLNKHVADLIAAGEVVERPASVVKELTENAIDSGATFITIEIKNGGKSFIRVTDNGCGIDKEDVKTAFLRHATSKIKTEDDLFKILTLGFRGEALASICAVSRTEMITRTENNNAGTHIKVSGGEILSEEEVGTPVGTTIIVRDLFFNVPARLKFLKKDQTEAAHIADVVDKLILSHPEISIKFISDGNERAYSSGDNNIISCAYAVFGKEYAREMLTVKYENEGITVSGAVAGNHISRANRNFQCFFVNGRYIKSKLLSSSVEEAFLEKMGKDRYPICVIKIDMNPSMVDINVHPAKTEAKFVDEQQISRAVYFAVENALKATKTEYEVYKTPKNIFRNSADAGDGREFYQSSFKTAQNNIGYENNNYTSGAANNGNYSLKEPDSFIKYAVNVEEIPVSELPKSMYEAEAYKPSEEVVKQAEIPDDNAFYVKESEPENKLQNKTENEDFSAEYRIIGQAFLCYILVEQNNNLYLIDQHAAHERQNFDKLKSYADSGVNFSQMLLAPVVLSLTMPEKASIMQNLDEFSKLGFIVEDFGQRDVIIRATPVPLQEEELSALILEILQSLEKGKRQKYSEMQKEILYQIACKSSIKANKPLTMEEMKAVADYVFSLEDENTCPHGRPVIISFDKYFIEKQFKRV